MFFRKHKNFFIFTTVSIVLHVLFLKTGLLNIKLDTMKHEQHKAPYVELSLVDPRKIVIPKIQKEVLTKNQQIVNNELVGKNERPQDSRFLGEKDMNYDRQTIARDVGAFQKAGGHQAKTHGQLKDLSALGVKSAQLNPEEFAFNKDEKKLGEKDNAKEEGLGDGPEKAVARNNDYIEDVPLGDVTHLNTTEFKYYGFYHRIRQKLEQFWGDSLRKCAERFYKSGERLPASENYITSLVIKIDAQGNIVQINVVGKSGIKELDSAAIEAFNRAGPFPNPPRGMISSDGYATIQWGFVVKG